MSRETRDRQEHRLTASDGVVLSLDQYGQGTGDAAVILCPGFFQSKNTPTFQRLAMALAESWDVIAMDFRGHGRSKGRYTFSANEDKDLEAVLDWASARYQQVGVLGFSLGAAAAINAVARRPRRVRSLIAVSTPCAFEEIEFKWWTSEAIRTGVQGLEPGAGCRPGSVFLKKARPIDTIRTFRQLPVLFIHGAADTIVGAAHSRRLYAAAPEPKRLEIIDGGGHAEVLFRGDSQRFRDLVNTWFAQTL